MNLKNNRFCRKMSKTIPEIYSDSIIVITGATGFIGKFLLEKILRDLNPKKIYLLIREKSGQTVDVRFEKLFKSPILQKFDGMKQKIQPIRYDLNDSEPGLVDVELIKTANFIFDCAATVRFDEPLGQTLRINVESLCNLLKLAKTMHFLKAFIYVSTAFSNCPQNYIKEQFYEPQISFDVIKNMIGIIPDEILIKPWPNCYTFSKFLAENLISKEINNLPIAVARPSIVMACLDEPIAGFDDSNSGSAVAFYGAAMGVINVIHATPSSRIHIIPVDYVVNNLIAIGWALTNQNEISRVFNCTPGDKLVLTVGEYFQGFYESMHKNPNKKMLKYPFYYIASNRFIYILMHILFHVIPCFYIPKGWKLSKKLIEWNNLLYFFMSRDWLFETTNNEHLWTLLADEDKKSYPFILNEFDWSKYIETACHSFKKYKLNETDSDWFRAKIRYNLLKFLHYTIITILIYCLYYLTSVLVVRL